MIYIVYLYGNLKIDYTGVSHILATDDFHYLPRFFLQVPCLILPLNCMQWFLIPLQYHSPYSQSTRYSHISVSFQVC